MAYSHKTHQGFSTFLIYLHVNTFECQNWWREAILEARQSYTAVNPWTNGRESTKPATGHVSIALLRKLWGG